VKTPALALFDLNAIVPNLVGAYREGVAAAFRMFDEELDEELLTMAVGLSYSEGVREVYNAHFSNPWPDEQRLFDLSEAYRKVVKRFVQFSASLNGVPYLLSTLQDLRKSGVKVGLCADLDRVTLAILVDRLGWNQDLMFDVVVTSDEGVTKPEIIMEALDQLNATDGFDSVMIGAVPADVEAGRICGIKRRCLLNSSEWAVEADGVEVLYSLSRFPAWVSGPAARDGVGRLREV
jgi:phosphoglycolate phosphatase-like HAD superfamily hydrolase